MVNIYTLNLPKQGMDVIVQALSELPYRVAKPVLDEAMRQFVAQEQAVEAEEAAKQPQIESPPAAE
jgi:hypothetical protein